MESCPAAKPRYASSKNIGFAAIAPPIKMGQARCDASVRSALGSACGDANAMSLLAPFVINHRQFSVELKVRLVGAHAGHRPIDFEVPTHVQARRPYRYRRIRLPARAVLRDDRSSDGLHPYAAIRLHRR